MRFGHLELFVRDPAVARAFYEEALGLSVVGVQGGGDFVWLRLDEREVLLRKGEPPPAPSSYRAATLGIVLYTDDLPGTRRLLAERGVEFLGEDEPGCLVFRDPDGHWFQLVDPSHLGG
jgi:catechol 2,3-dioxygenase-like lactoylglutathione lyase family enzyme